MTCTYSILLCTANISVKLNKVLYIYSFVHLLAQDCNPEGTEGGISETTLGPFVTLKESAEDEPVDVGVATEGLKLQHLGVFPLDAVCCLD